MATLFNPFFQAIDGNGTPLVGAKLNFYRTGSATRLDTYTSSALTSTNTNPVVANADGRFPPIYLGTASDYKIVLTDSADVTQGNGTIDPFFASVTEGRTAVADVAYAVAITDRMVAYTTLTASRTISLPAALNFPAGALLTIVDETGNAAEGVALSIAPNGTDTIDGSNTTQVCINIPRGRCQLMSNGTSKWDVLAWSVKYTNSLSGTVALNNTANFFTGPTVAQGTVGRWRAYGGVTLTTAGVAGDNFVAKLWDATTTIAGGAMVIGSAASNGTMAFSGMISAPAANIRIDVKATSRTDSIIAFNQSGTSKDSTLTVERVA